ncbi:beta-galactosidase [Truepera radiovictrix]|uniref:Beta-galactosidase n=1 Tax=Truepera radiovictrix (strain DSM 17093 / CIP 108686 / LMG 22925 / RQ-24) TaxID=649638 RepID=D7CR63_TRURR|nr:beta-galactosidase [Truepera radiovictrix]ADI15151.1 Beta-galactosidase [Truepera radiovictrix DSM 17093]WMT56296.1 beta-galactosidase [Truepera radiovictrix]
MSPRPHFPALLHGADYNAEQWLAYPEVLHDDLQLMKDAGVNCVSVGIFAWSMLEPEEGVFEFGWLDTLMDSLANEDIHVILATPSGARPAWLSERYPEVRQVDATGRRLPHAGRHNHCRTSPVYREKCGAINRLLASRYATHPALFMWHVSNEYGATPCHCELCYAAFRNWLRKRYGDLERLNHAWWTTFWSHRYRCWEEIRPVDPSIQGLMLDWQRFTSDQTLDFFLAESAPLRELTPKVPITTNFMQPDVGLDYWVFAPHVDVISWDSYPRWHQHGVSDAETAARTAFYHDLHRSYKKQPFMLMESTPSVTNWQGISRPKRPGLHRLASLQAVAHGSNSVQYFQWRQSRGGEEQFHGAVVTHQNTADTRVFREVAALGSTLQRLTDVLETNVEAQVAVIYDFQNEWALRWSQLPQNEAKDYQACCLEHYGALWRQGVATDILCADGELLRYRLVVAPMLYMLREGVAERLEAFVQGGGTLVMTHTTGLVDAGNLAFLGGFPKPLRRTLGLWVEESDALYPGQEGRIEMLSTSSMSGCYISRYVADLLRLETAQPLAHYTCEFYAATPAVTCNAHGAGRAYYLATRLDGRFLNKFYKLLLSDCGIRTFELPEGVSVSVRQGKDKCTVFVMNFNNAPQSVALESLGLEPVEVGPYGVEVATAARQTTSS